MNILFEKKLPGLDGDCWQVRHLLMHGWHVKDGEFPVYADMQSQVFIVLLKILNYVGLHVIHYVATDTLHVAHVLLVDKRINT